MQHLIIITFGPVQDFIAQARRGRDLWFGSHMLSEISKAAAKCLADQDVELIFPALQKDAMELAPHDSPSYQGKPVFNVANRVMGIVPENSDPRQLAEQAIKAARKRLSLFADDAREKAGNLLAPNIGSVWDEQISTLLEAYAVWEPLNGDLVTARQKAEITIAGRKNLRAFSQWEHQRGNVPKSSFDGMRETVLAEPAKRDFKTAARFRIPDGEQLDAVGLMKRVGGDPRQFVPIANVALAAWLEEAKKCPSFQEIQEKCLKHLELDRVERPDIAFVKNFPFDAQIFYENRIPSYLKEQHPEWTGEEIGEEVAKIKDCLSPLWKSVKGITPYVACLVADGDHMGASFDRQTNKKDLQTLSRTLARFAGLAQDIVQKQYRGALIYAGGDDVLAFVTLQDAVPCAQKLAETFASLFKNFQLNPTPTLSVGLGIGHVMDGMAHLLDLGRRAEKLAKGSNMKLPRWQVPRNALGILLDKRSGGTLSCRINWNSNPTTTFMSDLSLLDTAISTKKIYEIKRLVEFFSQMESTAGSTMALYGELVRILSRSHLGQERKPISPEDAGLRINSGDLPETLARIDEWVQRMRIVREIERTKPVCREKNKEENHD